MNNCQQQNSEEYLFNSNVENKNYKGIHCDMDNEKNTDATELFDFPSDISSTDDKSETTYGDDEEQLDYLSAKTHSLEKHPKIEHEFDIWHLTNSLMKRLKILEKKHPDVFLWKSSVNNHLWWSAQTCQGNGKILVEKFLSVLHHISNEHEWETSGEIKRCEHESISEKESNEKLWINPLSESFFALKKILTAKDFIKDLEQAKHFVHTGRPFMLFLFLSLQSGRRGNQIALCLMQAINSGHLSFYKRHLTVWSDNCAGQLKNRMLLFLCIWLVANGTFDTIEHTFFISGYSYSASDRDFATIEKRA
ncbi:hypothetical protein QTP88_008792 [Uroleucon formosanum]